MMIGISYNVYDGEELLEGNISQLRHLAYHISVVAQHISNTGEPAAPHLGKTLNDLLERGLIDEIIWYTPLLRSAPKKNEKKKRNIGLSLARKRGCTHFMSMDTDEYYEPKALSSAVKHFSEDVLLCQMETFWKSWEFCYAVPEEYYVPVMYRITPQLRFTSKTNLPVCADPTRGCRVSTYKILERDRLQMMHGSYIRQNIVSKLQNSSSIELFKDKISDLTAYFDHWSYPQNAWPAGVEAPTVQIKKSSYTPLKNLERYSAGHRIKRSNRQYFLNAVHEFLNRFSSKI